jgi:NADH dehydrogenase [ubiquinone] 1 alpha subcomplex assembly factor 5
LKLITSRLQPFSTHGGDNDNGSTASASTTNAFNLLEKRKQRNNTARAVKLWRQRQQQQQQQQQQNTDYKNDVVEYDYFRDEIAARLVDRLDDMKRAFPLALDWGSGSGHIYRAICAEDALVGFEDDDTPKGGIGGVQKLVQMESAHNLLRRDEDEPIEGAYRCDTYRMEIDDEETKLPFPDGTFDLVISSCSLHWVNKIPQVFAEVHRLLKPDGCFLMAMVGGTETLPELRAAMVLAELEREGGFSPHVGPFIQVSDLGSLLQRAGFALPTIDVDSQKIVYPNAAVLMEHLQRTGENNAAIQRRKRVSLDTFLAAACLYDELFPAMGAKGCGEIEASVQVIYAVGWTPHASQPQPKKRGSATHKVGEIVDHNDPSSNEKVQDS